MCHAEPTPFYPCKSKTGIVVVNQSKMIVCFGDLKTVKPHTGHKWLMLLAVDFSSKKCFARDLDYGKGDWARMLRLVTAGDLDMANRRADFRNVKKNPVASNLDTSLRRFRSRPLRGLQAYFLTPMRVTGSGRCPQWHTTSQPRLAHHLFSLWRVLRAPQS